MNLYFDRAHILYLYSYHGIYRFVHMLKYLPLIWLRFNKNLSNTIDVIQVNIDLCIELGDSFMHKLPRKKVINQKLF